MFCSIYKRISGACPSAPLVLFLSLQSPHLQAAESGSSKISKDEIQALVEQSSRGDFPVELTRPVMKRLSFLLNQPAQVEGLKQELNRMERYQSIVLPQLEKSGLPLELAAIPMVETGYKNHPPHRNGAGLWMITRNTAAAYDLSVAGKNDERLNPEKATEAAIQILKDYYERFNDWLLALAAYNQGPTHVADVIRETEIRDGWLLIAQGHLNDYAAKVIAAAIIIEHQEALLGDG
ncbi:lytic transglycosylase domain-containing protein [Oligoflexus tunisiensis]|uniref:lytic transglycosylase domain-containing protein n=1 Tax=Oligoflexus tunisiensis TaxID=708132 RepID=UPI00159EFD6F|nr:lytic transglycosylase domain-containing protein [Oligoflexus tunisiensis]